MDTKDRRPVRTVLLWLGVAALLAMSFFVGAAITGRTASVSSSSQSVDEATRLGAPDVASESKAGYDMAQSPPAASGDAQVTESAGTEAISAPAASGDSLVITNASMSLRVEEIDAALREVRTAASANGAEITDLSVYAGDETPVPQPLVGETGASYDAPASANVTLRVPAASLKKLQDDISEIGTVLSQSITASDVTEEHIDLSARLKNLKAEEVRLRSFLEQTNKVSELLQVERELARVRGEIEAIQAQVDYLERQAARATLVVSLTEPGPVVRPSGDDWGFGAAITRGVQTAVALLTTILTGLIAIAPLALLALGVWLVVRAIRRRRHRASPDERVAADEQADATPDSGDDESA